jgi:hypothetical protein
MKTKTIALALAVSLGALALAAVLIQLVGVHPIVSVICVVLLAHRAGSLVGSIERAEEEAKP